ncbi:hypothetical protein X658_0214845 [Brucella neotomae 5K33]|nr:hypothetical protein X658_0214845 [Brucella neotomae 5K33]
MSLFDHIGFKARDINRSLSFYESCMPELGLDVIARSGSGFSSAEESVRRFHFCGYMVAILPGNMARTGRATACT